MTSDSLEYVLRQVVNASQKLAKMQSACKLPVELITGQISEPAASKNDELPPSLLKGREGKKHSSR
jgi:hypothetical protein